MTTPSFNSANFRLMFPAFADTTAFPDAQLSGYWTMGTAYISLNNPGCMWTDAQAQLGNDLMCAHLTQLFVQIGTAPNDNGITGVITGATEGSVSASLAPPPTTTGYQYWLSSTPYGQQLRALLEAVGSVGMFVGGSPERAAFRKAGGVF